MKKNEVIVNEDYRMKVVNFLKIYGDYKGVLVKIENEKKYINGELFIVDIINNKNDYRELKYCIDLVLDYCYRNRLKEMEKVMEYFYKVECLNLRKQFGGLIEKFLSR